MMTKTGSSRGRRARWIASGIAVAAALAAAYYATAVEPRAWRLRRLDVPILPPGSEPFRILHLSDLHMIQRQHGKQDWLRSLAALDPDLVAVTGDHLASADAVEAVLRALTPLGDRPGAFVMGNSDYFGPVPKGPWAYRGAATRPKPGAVMPTTELGGALEALGWKNLSNRRTVIEAGGRRVEVSGVDDPSLARDDYAAVAGGVDTAADLHLGFTHTPEPSIISRFAADGFGLVLAGHTHGGQVRIPRFGALVTNCGIDRRRARGLHRWRDHTYLHVSAGVGTSPFAPVRFGCPPEAVMLTLVPHPQRPGRQPSSAPQR